MKEGILKQKYISLGMNDISKDKFNNNLINNGINKPYGGLWNCKYTPNKEFVSAWEEFCTKECFCDDTINSGVIFNLKNNTRVYVIDTLSDLINLADEYSQESILPFTKLLDFTKIAKDFDCIYLTDRGQCETRFSREVSLYGWDVESLLILNFDCIDLHSIERYIKGD